MRRRTALGALASGLLVACGGGGGGTGATGAAGASGTGPQPTAFSGNASIAAWGDSHTTGLPDRSDVPGYAPLLQQLAAGRQVFQGGYAGLTSTQIADQQVLDTAHDDWVQVFWYGGNNQTQSATIKADLARSIASLAPGNNRYLVLSVVNQAVPWERRGTADYASIMQLNADLAAQYGDRFLDVRSYLVGLYNPADANDVADHADDVVPGSLRADGVHLNVVGAAAVARRVLDALAAKGW